MDSLVSVIVPTYNAFSTLPLALASLSTQTYKNWECIVVDDGSTDDTAELMAETQRIEPRIHYIQLKKNCGRAVARQVALDNAHGQYLAMVDADDWIYPTKIERQVSILEAHSDLALVSSGLAIVDSDNDLLNVRFLQQQEVVIHPALRAPRLLPVAHAPSMLRMKVAKSIGYDHKLFRSEDVDFLLPILMTWPFANIGNPLYAYAEHNSLNSKAIISSQVCNIKMFWKYWSRFPLNTIGNIGIILVKLFITLGIRLTGQEHLLSRLRPSVSPSFENMEEFDYVRQLVLKRQQDIFYHKRS